MISRKLPIRDLFRLHPSRTRRFVDLVADLFRKKLSKHHHLWKHPGKTKSVNSEHHVHGAMCKFLLNGHQVWVKHIMTPLPIPYWLLLMTREPLYFRVSTCLQNQSFNLSAFLTLQTWRNKTSKHTPDFGGSFSGFSWFFGRLLHFRFHTLSFLTQPLKGCEVYKMTMYKFS